MMFIEECRKKKRNIIMSSEALDDLTAEQVQTLVKTLEGFEVNIIYVYRNALSMMISLHNQLNKHVERSSFAFSTYLMGALTKPSGFMRTLRVLDTYTTVVDTAHLHIIDHAGTEASDTDLTYVIVCEIIGLFCNKKAMFASPTEENTSRNLVAYQVYAYFKAYLQNYHSPANDANSHCHICKVEETFPAFEKYVQERSNRDKLPLLHTTLHLLAPYAKEVDAALRTKYGARILHGNATANYEVIDHGIAVEELNVEEFNMEKYWRDWLEKMYQWAAKRDVLCDCEESE